MPVVRGQSVRIRISCRIPRSPPHDHVRLDHFAGNLQVGAGFVHVEADGVDFVAVGLRQAIAGGGAEIDPFVRQAEQPLC